MDTRPEKSMIDLCILRDTIHVRSETEKKDDKRRCISPPARIRLTSKICYRLGSIAKELAPQTQ